MIQKKICMVGAFAVGKTSLVSRFVDSIFSDKYHTTVGVKIAKKVLEIGTEAWHLLLWDLAGEDEFLQVRTSYLCGSSGYILVVDGTRRATLDMALDIQQRIVDAVGPVPFIILFNKADLTQEWDITQEACAGLAQKGWTWLKASAKTGEGVEEAFEALVAQMQER
ncbi:MAG: GTP-binding protein [Candidatus Tectomicrobia bacterium]|uniref:GTP-binding protein n=1 Tax=Tectimicrobiota bacterium TaxID=2528274 RepID=A0A938B311_UNCTE|nr:GTP-binding protein [Candidatus Tectomicrobia bacterium]